MTRNTSHTRCLQIEHLRGEVLGTARNLIPLSHFPRKRGFKPLRFPLVHPQDIGHLPFAKSVGLTIRPFWLASALGTIEVEPSAMKQPSTIEPAGAPSLPTMGSVDTGTLELLAAWKAEDATTDPEKLREADEQIAEFKKAMNENRAATGARLLFPRAVFSFSTRDHSVY
jgi:hypothetical protein